jgi:hypothetical protein
MAGLIAPGSAVAERREIITPPFSLKELTMRSIFAGAVMVAALASTASAQTVTAYNGPDPFATNPVFANQSMLLTFNDCTGPLTPPGVTITGGGCRVGTTSGQYAEPWKSYSGSGYYTTLSPYSPNPSTVTITFNSFLSTLSVNSVSLYWGSIDSYQSLEVLDRSGNVMSTITGNSVANPNANGDQFNGGTNRRVNLAFNGGSSTFGGLRFKSTQAAFEFDDIAIDARGGAQVPEPSTFGLLAAGLGALGMISARRKRNA